MGNPTKGSMVVGGGCGGYLVRAVSGLDKCMVRKGSSAPASNGRLKPGRALQCTPMHQEQHNECIRGSNAPLIVPITAALHFQARQPPLSRTEGALIGERTFTGGTELMHNVRRCNFLGPELQSLGISWQSCTSGCTLGCQMGTISY